MCQTQTPFPQTTTTALSVGRPCTYTGVHTTSVLLPLNFHIAIFILEWEKKYGALLSEQPSYLHIFSAQLWTASAHKTNIFSPHWYQSTAKPLFRSIRYYSMTVFNTCSSQSVVRGPLWVCKAWPGGVCDYFCLPIICQKEQWIFVLLHNMFTYSNGTTQQSSQGSSVLMYCMGDTCATVNQFNL